MNPLLQAISASNAQPQMTALDMQRLAEMSQAKRQRYSKILQRYTGDPSGSATMKRNNLGTATSMLLSMLAGSAIGATAGYFMGDPITRTSLAMGGAMVGGAGGALVGGAGNIIGGIAGSISKASPEEAVREYTDMGASRYLIPGAAAYHKARLNNVLTDAEEGVTRPTQIIA